MNFETLYNKWKFLEGVNKRFSGSNKKTTTASKKTNTKDTKKTTKKNAPDAEGGEGSADAKAADGKQPQDKNADNKKKKGFTQEVALNDSTSVDVKHGQNSKRIIVRATTKEGKTYKLKYRKVDENSIRIKNRDTIPLKISVVAKEPLYEKNWYKTAQVVARGLMMVRNASVSYRNTYSLTLPGFRTEIGDAFGQKSIAGKMSPGWDFAFGAVGNSYIQKAADNGWLLVNDSNITTPSTTTGAEDLSFRVSLEPIRDFKIDLDASRTVNKSRSVQFMYKGMPATQSGSFTQTIISFSTAFGGSGNINNNYRSKPFNEFLSNIEIVRQRLEEKYASATYPEAAEDLAGKPYNPELGSVPQYSADVLIPAFLAAYCGGDVKKQPLTIFPALSRMLPNWRVTYSGLAKLPWFADHFKSFNINHQYKSTYSVGAYNSYSNFMEYMGDFGFITDVTTGNPVPSSMYNVSTVSINEQFSPLLGVDMTFNNGITAKVEYKTVRSLNLSVTSVALTESNSNDIVVGFGCKFKDLNLFGAKRIQSGQKKSKNKKGSADEDTNNSSNSRTAANRRNTVSHDLNLRCDFSYRMQNALNRNIQTMVTTATNGSTAYKVSLAADYTFSRLLTLSGYMDWQRNEPLVSASSYPTTTADFGVSMKFSLTR